MFVAATGALVMAACFDLFALLLLCHQHRRGSGELQESHVIQEEPLLAKQSSSVSVSTVLIVVRNSFFFLPSLSITSHHLQRLDTLREACFFLLDPCCFGRLLGLDSKESGVFGRAVSVIFVAT